MLKMSGLLLVISSCLIGAATSAGADGGYRIINTGIASGDVNVCWYDATRLVLLKAQPASRSRPYEAEGIFYIDVKRPTDLQRIDLSPLDPLIQKQISRVSCQGDALVFSAPGSQPWTMRLYSLKIGQQPELVSDMRAGHVHLQGRYVLGNSRKVVMEPGPLRGTFEGNDNCAIAYVKPGFRVLCWDTWLEHRWPLTRFVLTEYRWQETIKVRGEDGKLKEVKNPQQPLRYSGGDPIAFALLLLDLNNNVLMNLSQDETWGIPAQAYGLLDISPDEKYLYTGCRRKGQQNGSGLDRVCRYPLDGEPHQWEEVFAIDEGHVDQVSIELPNVSNTGDVLFVVRGNRRFPGIWRYSAKTKTISQVGHPSEYSGSSFVSPDGKCLAFVRREHGESRLILGISEGDLR
jgi:hypothetical protein